MAKNCEVSPALLCKTKADCIKKLNKIKNFAKRAQIDIMDGKFVKNKTIQPKQLAGLKTKTKIEMHLMVKDPADYVLDCCKADTWMIIFHYESFKTDKERLEFINTLRAHRYQIGIAINPETSAAKIKPFLKLIDLVLVMTIHPGKGGQKLLPKTIPKIRQIRKWNKKIDIEVDGGINKTTAKLVKKAGANILVAGSFIFKNKNSKKAFSELKTSKKA